MSDSNDNSIFITNIKWWKDAEIKNKINQSELPESFQISIPNNMIDLYKTNFEVFKDDIESFIYNFLTRKFGIKVSFCQIWLPIEEK